MAKPILLATIVSTIVLFGWSGLTQNFPWGVPTTQIISTKSAPDSSLPPSTIELLPGSLTTEQFDEQMAGKITTLTTDHTFSWIISKPMAYYDLRLYFAREVFTQFLVSLLLALFLWNVRHLDVRARVTMVALTASAAAVATYGQNFNWMGMPAAFAGGNAVNLIVGWSLVAFIVSKWLIKTTS